MSAADWQSPAGVPSVADPPFHIVTVGWDRRILEELMQPVAARSTERFSHIMHPSYLQDEWPQPPPHMHFLRERARQPMPAADRSLLASLERDGVPTIHNMILSDRIVSKVPYEDALRYATFLARRLIELFERIRPDAIVGSFDALHGSVALAVAKSLHIPWFALNFSTLPPGLACFCDAMTPAARVQVAPPRPFRELLEIAEESLRRFETRSVQAYAYIAPPPPSLAARMAKVPALAAGVLRRLRKARAREYLQFTESVDGHSLRAALRKRRRAAAARTATALAATVAVPPAAPYVIFGLHMQPESSIDVWAPFFSDQLWVVELLARSLPPSHKLLVKIHKSDVAKYSAEQLARLRALPGVELVRPFADTRAFIEKADLVVGIQGTMGLEGALLGRPVIMLGDSPVTLFPSAARIGALTDLPALVRRKLAEPAPRREQIVQAYATYLAPFAPASHNDWSQRRTPAEIDAYVRLFGALKTHVASTREQRA